MQTLLGAFMDVLYVIVKSELVIQGESKIFEFLNLFYHVAMNGDPTETGCIKDQFFCFLNVEMEKIVCAPVCKV